MKLKDGKYLKIEWDSNTLKVVDKKYMEKSIVTGKQIGRAHV